MRLRLLVERKQVNGGKEKRISPTPTNKSAGTDREELLSEVSGGSRQSALSPPLVRTGSDSP